MSAQEDEFESDLLFLTDEEDITNDSPPEADWLGQPTRSDTLKAEARRDKRKGGGGGSNAAAVPYPAAREAADAAQQIVKKKFFGPQPCHPECGSCYSKEEMPVYIPEIAQVCCNMPINAAGIRTCAAKTEELWSMFTEFSLTKWLTMLHNEDYESKEATEFNNHNFRYVCWRLIRDHCHGRTKLPFRRTPNPMCCDRRLTELYYSPPEERRGFGFASAADQAKVIPSDNPVISTDHGNGSQINGDGQEVVSVAGSQLTASVSVENSPALTRKRGPKSAASRVTKKSKS